MSRVKITIEIGDEELEIDLTGPIASRASSNAEKAARLLETAYTDAQTWLNRRIETTS